MKMLTDEEIGVLLTREMKSMLLNEKIPAEKRLDIFRSIVEGTDIEDPMLDAFAMSLRVGYKRINDTRLASIRARRERQKIYSRERRTSTDIYIDERTSTDTDAHLRCKGKGKGKGKRGVTPHAPSSEDIGGYPAPMTISQVIDCGRNGTTSVHITESFCRAWYQAMEQNGWKDSSGQRITAGRVRPVMAGWFRNEKKFAARADGKTQSVQRQVASAPAADATAQLLKGGE